MPTPLSFYMKFIGYQAKDSHNYFKPTSMYNPFSINCFLKDKKGDKYNFGMYLTKTDIVNSVNGILKSKKIRNEVVI